MKRFGICSFLLLFLLSSSFSQSIISGVVVDKELGLPIPLVHIFNKSDSSLFTTSDNKGHFKLEILGNYEFSIIGYQKKIVNIQQSGIVVQLSIKASELNQVIVSANLIPDKLINASSTIQVLTQKDFQRENDINIAPLLNKVPGVYMQSGALNTNKITIRGIGSRNLYGTSKIKAYYQDIPLTSGSGETNIEDFELNSMARIEVLKGGTSSIYGAGLGGTIHLIPNKALLNQSSFMGGFQFGSFGLMKESIGFNIGSKQHSFSINYSNTHKDGYRENNEYDRQSLSFTSNHFLGISDELSIVASYVDLHAFIPSSLNEQLYIEHPTAAAFNWLRARGFEQSKRGIFGIAWNHQFKRNTKLVTSLFTSFRDAYEVRPFNILEESTFATGIRTRLLGNGSILDKDFEWTFGGEFFNDWHPLKIFENLISDSQSNPGSNKGIALSKFKERRTHFNFFFESIHHFSSLTTISFGINFNQTSYVLEDRFNENSSFDQSNQHKFEGILSPKIGINHLLSEEISIYGNISHGFSPPSLEETLMPDGKINRSIKPETGWNYEFGTRGTYLGKQLQFNLAIFSMDIKNLLLTRRTAEDEFIGINAGSTLHNGVESRIEYQWSTIETNLLSSYISHTYNNFSFKEFIENDEDFSGNQLPGIPDQIFNIGIDFKSQNGFWANLNYQYVAEMPITDQNEIYSHDYKLLNFKMGHQIRIGANWIIDAYFGLNNIFNEHYASQLLVNAQGFNGSEPRFYYPGEPINFYFGIKLKNKL